MHVPHRGILLPVYPKIDPEAYYSPNEKTRMNKTAILVQPTDGDPALPPEADNDFGSTSRVPRSEETIDIGVVAPESMSVLLQYWVDEQRAANRPIKDNSNSMDGKVSPKGIGFRSKRFKIGCR
jgi:hypothetical protein